MSLTAQRLRELLQFCPETGVFTWRVSRSKFKAGQVAGHLHSRTQYRCIGIDLRVYAEHRLAWLYVHGDWPLKQIDHINGIRSDNRLSNLREASCAENGQNRAVGKNSTSGLIGAYWDARAKRWRSHIKHNGKVHYLGYFVTAEQAHAAYLAKKADLHKFQPVPRQEMAA